MATFVDSYGKPGIFEDECGKFVWQPRGNGGFDIVRVVISPGVWATGGAGGAGRSGIARERPPSGDGLESLTTDELDAQSPFTRETHEERIAKTRAFIAQAREARLRPKLVTERELVPESVRLHYNSFWQGEQNALEISDQDRINAEIRQIKAGIKLNKVWWRKAWRWMCRIK